jgi:hypothetical protein
MKVMVITPITPTITSYGCPLLEKTIKEHIHHSFVFSVELQ